jgi:transcription elongation factor Elf1
MSDARPLKCKTEGSLIESMREQLREETAHIPDDIEISEGCPFCKSPKGDITLLEKTQGFGTMPVVYVYCTVCGISTPRYATTLCKKTAKKRAIHFWNTRKDEKSSQWSREKPTRDGWYWAKWRDGSTEVVRLIDGVFWREGKLSTYSTSCFDEFQGPIKPEMEHENNEKEDM